MKKLQIDDRAMRKDLGGIKVLPIWHECSQRWENIVMFHEGMFTFTFHDEDFGSLRAAFTAARQMRAGVRPEEMTPYVITSVRLGSFIVRPEYLEVQ